MYPDSIPDAFLFLSMFTCALSLAYFCSPFPR